MDRRRALRVLAALGAGGLAAAACGNKPPADEDVPTRSMDVRIGMLVPQTGGYKPIGDEIINGFQLYLALNEGRLGGYRIELEIEDEGETERSGKAGFERLLERGVTALTGVVSSAVMSTIKAGVREAKVPLVGSNASPTNLQGEAYIWRTSFVNDEAGRAMGPHVANVVKGPIGLIAPKYAAGTDAIQGFRESFGRRDPRLPEETVWTGTATDPAEGYYRRALADLRALQPSAVYCFFAGAAAVRFVREYRSSGITAPLYAAGFLTEGSALTQLGSAAEGIFTALNYSADLPNGANRVFTSAYRKTHGTSPTTYAMASYDAAQVLDKALTLAGDSPSPQRVNLMLGRVGLVTSPRGTWQFNQSRTPQQKWYLREVRRDGRMLSNVLLRELNTLG